jgi:nicotinamide phosphoribosyltransferase
MDAILTAIEERGWAANNIVFGCGGKLNQCVNRDTERFAGKCSAACIDGVWKDVYKDPVTSNRKGDFTKASKRGLQVYSLNKELIKGYTNSIPVEGKKMNLEELYHYQLDGNSLMKLVFENGKEIK